MSGGPRRVETVRWRGRYDAARVRTLEYLQEGVEADEDIRIGGVRAVYLSQIWGVCGLRFRYSNRSTCGT